MKCFKCKKDITNWQHYFAIESNHPEQYNSWDTIREYYHEKCISKTFNLRKKFNYHIKGEY